MKKNNALILGFAGLVIIGLIIAITVIALRASDTALPVVTPIADTKPAVTNTPTAPVSNTPGIPQIISTEKPIPNDTAVSVNSLIIPHGALTNYWYEYGTSTNLGSKTSKQEIGSGYVARSTPGYITGLISNKTYYYRVVAENKLGRIESDKVSFQTTQGNPPPAGTIPTVRTLNASSVSRTSATLNAEVTANRSETSYWFEYGTSKDFSEGTEVFLAGNSSSQLSVHRGVTQLQPASTYYYRVNAQNGFGTVHGAMISFKTAGPIDASAPTVSTGNVSSVRSSSATLRGTVNPNGAAAVYWFEYSTGSIVGSIVPTVTDKKSIGNGTADRSIQLDVNQLVAKTTYYVQLVAQNSFGTNKGERVSFTTK